MYILNDYYHNVIFILINRYNWKIYYIWETKIQVMTHTYFSKQLVLFFIIYLGSTLSAYAQITSWEVNGLTGYGASPFTATASDANAIIGGLTRGAGITTSGTASGNAWGGNGFNVADQATAITNNKFVTFTVRPATGYTLNLASISAYNVRKSTEGPTSGIWQYSLDGTNFTNIGTTITWGTNITAAGNAQAAIDLSGITALQNVPNTTTITFRIVIWGASDTAGTWYINNIASGNDLELNGAVILVGAPTSNATDFFRSRQNGNFNTPNTWESSTDSSTWINATLVPTSSANITTIRTGHTIRANSSITIDQLTINLGGTLNYTTGLITLSNGAGDDMIVEGVFNHNGGTALSIQSAATVRIRAGGEIRASDNATGIGDLYAGNGATAFTYETNAIFHWNISLVFATEGQTYFGNSGTNVPIFLITQNVGNVGANTFTTFNGVLVVDGNITFVNAGIKTFRNGISGTGTITQSPNSGQFIINGTTSTLGGNIVLNSTVTASSNTLLQSGLMVLSSHLNISAGTLIVNGSINLNGFNLDLGTSGQIQEDRANNHFITDLTATGDGNIGGAVLFNGTVTDISAEIRGTGLFLRRTTGADYTVTVARRHYRAEGLGIKKVYDLTGVATNTNTTMRILYANNELEGLSVSELIMFRKTASSWKRATDTGSGFGNGTNASNYVEAININAFSEWTASNISSPLPITLLNFEGIRDTEGTIHLRWQTIQERDNLGFEVEVSEDGQIFENIAFVEGQGNASSPRQYELSYDKFEAAYYRLKQIDTDGEFNYFPVIFISAFVPKVLLYPNPIQSGQILKLIGLEANKLYQISLRNTQGQTLQRFQSKGAKVSKILETKIPFLNAGVYFLEMHGAAQKTVLKLVKE